MYDLASFVQNAPKDEYLREYSKNIAYNLYVKEVSKLASEVEGVILLFIFIDLLLKFSL